jgi:methionyl-tRNA formyltransferase
VLLQRKTNIGAQETTPMLYERLSKMGAEALMETLGQIEKGTTVPIVQDTSVATKAPKLSKEESWIDWTLQAAVIFNKLRAFKPFPGTATFRSGKRLGIEWAEVIADESHAVPGTITRVNEVSFTVQCGKGQLKVTELKPEGKRSMSTREFLLGSRVVKGEILG